MATDLERMVVSLEASITKYERTMARAMGITNQRSNEIESRLGKLQVNVERAFALMGRGIAALGIGLSVREVIEFSDAWTRATNSLKVVGLEGETLNGVMTQLFDAAQRQGVPIGALTTLYGRAAQSSAELGASQQDLIQFSEDVATALRVAGTSPEEATGALLQLSQALGSARVQAEEFNSINEGARPILQAVANGIEEAGGSVSRLKQMVNDGEISNVAFFKGFQAGAEGIRQQAGSATDTISQGFTRVSNAVTKAIGELGESSGAAKNAATNLGSVASAIEQIPAIVDKAAAKLGDLAKALNDVGNSSFWKRVGAALGVQYSAAEAAANGITLVDPNDPRTTGINALKAGRGQALADGFNVSDFAGGAVKNKVKASDYPVVGDKEKKAGRERIEQFDREVAALQRRREALQLDAEMMGRSTYEVERARAQQDLLSAARAQYGDSISPSVRARIDEEASAYARVAAAAEEAARSNQEWIGLQQEVGGFLSDNIAAVAAGYQDFNDVLKNGVGLITQMVLQAALLGQGPLGGMFGMRSSGNGVGGLVGSIFSAFGGFRAKGGPVLSGQSYLVGERGPELLTMGGRSGFITPNTDLPSRGGGHMTYAPSFSIDARGSTMSEDQFRRIASEESLRAVRSYDRTGFPARLAQYQARGV